MPHEVIMPALGMAQDTGLIVAWHKAAGDRVAPGDVLMEVETDKATMEVEAQAEGFLTNVRATAGDAVPVGDVIAMISENAEEIAGEPATKQTPATEPDAVPADGKTVIMPALGMAQDTGLLVAWRKAPGDVVAAGDILLEVETDKSTMEVEAGHDGYVAELRAEPGDNVPVGEVIAIISTDKPDAPTRRNAATPPASPAPKTGGLARETPPPPAPDPSAAKSATPIKPTKAEGGRILASPKARHLAAERGLDLALLVKAGHPQPYHVADLDRLTDLAAASSAAAPAGAARDSITAGVSGSGFAEFQAWLHVETGVALDNLAVWAAFAGASLRAATGAETLTISVETPLRQHTALYTDPDLCGLGDIEQSTGDPEPVLILRDLTRSRVTGVSLASDTLPVVTVASEGDNLILTFEAPGGTMPAHSAITFISDMAARLEEPLRHIL